MIDFMKLREPFPPERISWRVGSTNKDKTKGMALAFIDARDVQDRLDEVCGPDNWQNRYSHASEKTICEIGLKIDGEWVWKSDGSGDTDFEAEKGSLSGAFKRAAVKWGIGRYLYDVHSPWVAIEPMGKSYKIVDDEYSKLNKLLSDGNKSAPANNEPTTKTDTEAVQKAANWCYTAIDAVKKSASLNDLDAWQKANAKWIVRAKEVAPEAQARLIDAIEKRRGDFNPLSA